MTDSGRDYHPASTQRPRRPLRALGERVLPPLARHLVSLLWRTCRLQVLGGEILAARVSDGDPVILCYWHRHQIFCVRALLELRKSVPALKLGYLISPSRDGDAAARVFADLDLHIVRGSATRGGAQALREIYQAIRKHGISPIVTPDGPTGPLEVFKPGVAMLASLAGTPIVPMSFAASRAIRLSSWDRAVIPWPFARIVVAIGEPLTVAKGASGDALEQASVAAGDALKSVGNAAEQALGK